MDRFKPIYAYLLLALAVAFTYANSLDVDFTYDDYAFVYNNEEIRSFTPLSKFLLSFETFAQPAHDHVYRPLASFTFAMNYAFNGLDPVGYHIVNLLFHTFNVFLLFVLLQKIGFRNGHAFVGALIFAVHPVHTEAVTWISGRGNVLFLFFFLMAYLFYVKIDSVSAAGEGLNLRNAALSLGVLAMYGMSLLAKEMALPLPALLFGHDLYFHRGWNRRQWLKRMPLYVLLAIVAVAYILLRTHVLGKVGQVSYHGGSAFITFLVMLKAAALYARLLLVPVDLALVYHFEPSYSIFEASVFPSFCLVVLVIIAGVVTFRRNTYFSFSLFWLAVTILPVSNIIPVNALVADRFLYGPSIGLCILVAAFVAGTDSTSRPKRLLAVSVLCIVFSCFMLLSIGRNNDWKNSITLWQKTTKSSPSSDVAFNNLGLEYMKAGRLFEAIKVLNETVRIKNDLPEAHVNLAICYKEIGETGMAIRHYETALSIPGLAGKPEIRCRLAKLLAEKGRFQRAIEEYEAAVMEDPRLLEAHLELAYIYEKSNIEKAVEHYEAAKKLAPNDHDIFYRLGLLYYEQKNFSNAVDALQKNLAINPQNQPARKLLEKIKKNRAVGPISD